MRLRIAMAKLSSLLSWPSNSFISNGRGPSTSGALDGFLRRNQAFCNAASTSTLSLHQTMFYSETGIDRAAELRDDLSWISNAFKSDSSLVIPVLEGKNIIKHNKPLLISPMVLEAAQEYQPVFLGVANANRQPLFTIDIKSICSKSSWHEGAEWVDLRSYGPKMQPFDAGLLAYARGMIDWHSRNKFCGRCGGQLLSTSAGHSLNCASCNNTIYPRLDPAVIVLVSCGNYALLGRKGSWEQGRYSLLSGFVELGETFEMAVAREINEEAGVIVDPGGIRYAASQPWPFPSSLMVAFKADVKKVKSVLDKESSFSEKCFSEDDDFSCLPRPVADMEELEDVRWIHKDFLKAVLHGDPIPHNIKFSVPGKHAIAYLLLQDWISSGSNTAWSGAAVKNVAIDEGTFKYILIRIEDELANQKLVVRGSRCHAYHADVLQEFNMQISHLGLQVEAVGGGRIEHCSDRGRIHVYGYSQAYGQANHNITSMILKQWYPFHEILVSWDGY